MAKNIKDLFDATAFDSEGEKIGSVKEVFVNDDNGQPTFVEVNHGLFGMGSSLVPLRGHKFTGEELTLAFPKDRIKDAPEFDTDSALTPEQQSEIFRHYGVENATDTTEYANENAGAGVAGAGAGAAQDRERTAADRDDRTADNEIIRSEERANVSKDRVATGEARLRKYVVSDKETVEVPVTREEVSVERTPISEADAKNYDGKIGEDEASVTLHEDKVNVEKETVPVEKINLNKDQVQDTERHTTELRKEQVDTEGAHLKDERTDRK